MAIILNKKKSTTGSPYVYYTVEATPSNRTTTSVDLTIKITSNLASSSSVLGSTYDLTCYLKFNNVEFSIKIKDNESWSGTASHTKTKTITVPNLSATATSLTGTTFRALGYNSSSDRAGYTTTTACSDLTIPAGHLNPSDVYFTIQETEPSLISAGISNELFVANLSNKKFTVGATFYDGATMQRVWAFNQSTSNLASVTTTSNPATLYYNFKEKTLRRGFNGINPDKVPIRIIIFDSLDGATSKPASDEGSQYYFYDFAYYDKLVFNNQNTKAKRNGQTTGNVRLSIVGEFFRGVLGNKDQTGSYKPTIQYKYWKQGTTEPSTYGFTIPSGNINVSSTYTLATGTYQDTIYYYKLVNGQYQKLIYEVDYFVGNTIEDNVYVLKHNFKVENYEVGSNVETASNYFNPEYAYKFKIKVSDNFTTSEIEKEVPVGIATWTEYKDRVDFQKLTIQGFDIQSTKTVTGDWNTACGEKSGFFMGSGLANSPSGTTVSNWYFVHQMVHNNLYKVQLAYSFGYGLSYIRSQAGGGWSSWKRIADEEDINYKEGDTYILPSGSTINIGGCMTDSKLQVRSGLFVHKSLKKIKSITVNYIHASIRYTGGGYLVSEKDITANTTAYVNGENAIYLVYKASSAMSGTNNTPIAIQIHELRLTFHE